MNSKIFVRSDGTFTMKEFEEVSGKRIQNASTIPPKYSPDDKFGSQRRKANNLN